jgi:hypothetical protein
MFEVAADGKHNAITPDKLNHLRETRDKGSAAYQCGVSKLYLNMSFKRRSHSLPLPWMR